MRAEHVVAAPKSVGPHPAKGSIPWRRHQKRIRPNHKRFSGYAPELSLDKVTAVARHREHFDDPDNAVRPHRSIDREAVSCSERGSQPLLIRLHCAPSRSHVRTRRFATLAGRQSGSQRGTKLRAGKGSRASSGLWCARRFLPSSGATSVPFQCRLSRSAWEG